MIRIYVYQWYHELGEAEAALVPVVLGETTAGIGAKLEAGGSISGWVGAPGVGSLLGIQVKVYAAGDASTSVVETSTDANGQYTIRGVAPGSYKIAFDPSLYNQVMKATYILEWYADKTGFATANSVLVGKGQNVKIEARLVTGLGPSWASATDGVHGGKVVVTWQNIAGETGFRVYRRGPGEADFTLIGETDANIATFDDPQGCGSAISEYRVTAVFSGGAESGPSPTNAGSTRICAPSVPSGLAASDGVGKFFIDLSWGDVEMESGYRVSRALAGTATFTLIATLGPEVTEFQDKRECGGTEYVYKVQAFNAGGESDFSLADSGFTDTCGLSVDTPKAWLQGSQQVVTWGGEVDTGMVKVDLYKGAVLNRTLVASTPNDKEFGFTVPPTLPPGTDYRLKVSWTGNLAINGLSDPFTVASPKFEVTHPSGGAVEKGSQQTITWTSTLVGGDVRIQLYKVGVATPTTIAASVPNSGSYPWVAPAKPLAGTYRMRVSWVANPTVFGEGGSFTFAAVAGSLKVTEPVLNETVEQGAVRQIRWEGIPATGNVLIQLKNALGIKTTIAASAPHNGSFPWKVPATLAKGEYTVAVTWLSDTTYTDESDVFTVASPKIAVTHPSGGAVEKGSQQTITWTSTLVGGNVRIQLYKEGVATPTRIAASVPNSGSYPWVAPAKPLAGTYRMRVSWISNLAVFGEGAGFTFAAVAGPLKVTEPVLNETVEQGAVLQIKWAGIPGTGKMLIQLKSALGVKTTIAASAPNTGSFAWTVPATLSTAAAVNPYTVVVTWLSDTTYTDESDVFTVASPKFEVTHPSGGAVEKGSQQTITWTSTLVGGT